MNVYKPAPSPLNTQREIKMKHNAVSELDISFQMTGTYRSNSDGPRFLVFAPPGSFLELGTLSNFS